MFLKFFLNFLIELESFVWEMLPWRDGSSSSPKHINPVGR